MSGASNSQPQPGGAGSDAVRVSVAQAINRSRQLLTANDLNGAESIAQSVLSQRPRHAEAAQILAAMAEKRGELPRAIELLQSVLTGGSADGQIQMNLCRSYRQ